MQNSSIIGLEKKAIDFALNANWKGATEINSQILEKDPNNIDAKLRLGKAYLQLKEFNKAKKLFKDVLSIDPINTTAQKNLKLATEKKSERRVLHSLNSNSLIIEPGTSTEAKFEITAKRVFSEDFTPGEKFNFRIEKNGFVVLRVKEEEEIELGTINGDVLQKLQWAKTQNAKVEVYFAGGKEKIMEVLVKCSIPVFRGEKQDIKPYIKKDSIDEPELELPDTEE